MITQGVKKALIKKASYKVQVKQLAGMLKKAALPRVGAPWRIPQRGWKDVQSELNKLKLAQKYSLPDNIKGGRPARINSLQQTLRRLQLPVGVRGNTLVRQTSFLRPDYMQAINRGDPQLALLRQIQGSNEKDQQALNTLKTTPAVSAEKLNQLKNRLNAVKGEVSTMWGDKGMHAELQKRLRNPNSTPKNSPLDAMMRANTELRSATANKNKANKAISQLFPATKKLDSNTKQVLEDLDKQQQMQAYNKFNDLNLSKQLSGSQAIRPQVEAEQKAVKAYAAAKRRALQQANKASMSQISKAIEASKGINTDVQAAKGLSGSQAMRPQVQAQEKAMRAYQAAQRAKYLSDAQAGSKQGPSVMDSEAKARNTAFNKQIENQTNKGLLQTAVKNNPQDAVNLLTGKSKNPLGLGQNGNSNLQNELDSAVSTGKQALDAPIKTAQPNPYTLVNPKSNVPVPQPREQTWTQKIKDWLSENHQGVGYGAGGLLGLLLGHGVTQGMNPLARLLVSLGLGGAGAIGGGALARYAKSKGWV